MGWGGVEVSRVWMFVINARITSFKCHFVFQKNIDYSDILLKKKKHNFIYSADLTFSG